MQPEEAWNLESHRSGEMGSLDAIGEHVPGRVHEPLRGRTEEGTEMFERRIYNIVRVSQWFLFYSQIIETMSYTDNVADFMGSISELDGVSVEDLEAVAPEAIQKVRSQPNSPFGEYSDTVVE